MPDSTAKQIRTLRVRDRWALAAILVLMLVAQWGAIAWWINAEERQARANTEKILSQLTSSVREETLRLMKLVEAALLSVDHWLAANPRIDPRSDLNFLALVNDLRRATDGVIDIRMVSSDGKLFYIPTPGGKALADVSDRDYYKAQLDPATRGLFIATPLISRVTRKPGLPISWPLRREVGGIGIVFAAIELDRLWALNDAQRMKPSGTIAIIRADGLIINRTPYDPSLLGRSIADTPSFREHLAVRDTGIYRSAGEPTDGIARFVSHARVGNYPLIVAVTAGVDDTMAEVRERRTVVLVLGSVLSLVLAALAASLYLNLLKAQEAEEELGKLAATDVLTGLLNRGAFFRQADAELARARRYGRPLAVIALDVDHFKQVNDTRGHAAGDAVLRSVAQLWRETLRVTDCMGRMGGEEFCVVLPETGIDTALALAERLRADLERVRMAPPYEDVAVTVSIGVSMLADSDQRIQDAIARADSAMYDAKRDGRNCVRRG
jgi:diguanylate cyclase (GGDEF)-like protein